MSKERLNLESFDLSIKNLAVFGDDVLKPEVSMRDIRNGIEPAQLKDEVVERLKENLLKQNFRDDNNIEFYQDGFLVFLDAKNINEFDLSLKMIKERDEDCFKEIINKLVDGETVGEVEYTDPEIHNVYIDEISKNSDGDYVGTMTINLQDKVDFVYDGNIVEYENIPSEYLTLENDPVIFDALDEAIKDKQLEFDGEER